MLADSTLFGGERPLPQNQDTETSKPPDERTTSDRQTQNTNQHLFDHKNFMFQKLRGLSPHWGIPGESTGYGGLWFFKGWEETGAYFRLQEGTNKIGQISRKGTNHVLYVFVFPESGVGGRAPL